MAQSEAMLRPAASFLDYLRLAICYQREMASRTWNPKDRTWESWQTIAKHAPAAKDYNSTKTARTRENFYPTNTRLICIDMKQ